MAKKKSPILIDKYEKIIAEMDGDDVKQVILAIYTYNRREDKSDFSFEFATQTAKMVFMSMRNDYEAIEKYKERQREHGLRGGNPTLNQPLSDPYPTLKGTLTHPYPKGKDKDKDKDKCKDNFNKTLLAESSDSLTDFDSEFETVWELYPNKKGKDAARNDFIKARKSGVALDEIENGIKNYVAFIEHEKIEPKFVKYGSSFFHQHSWSDNYDYKTKNDRIFRNGNRPSDEDIFENYGGM